VTRLGIAPDDYDSTLRMVEQGSPTRLITPWSVGGEFDFVKNVQDALGVERRLWGVAMKPGSHRVWGTRSTLVLDCRATGLGLGVVRTVRETGAPSVDGHKRVVKPLYKAIVEEEVLSKDSRTYVVRVRAWREADRWHVSSTDPRAPGYCVDGRGQRLIFVPALPRWCGRVKSGFPSPARGSQRSLNRFVHGIGLFGETASGIQLRRWSTY